MKPKSNSDLILMLLMAVASIFFVASAAGDLPRLILSSVILVASLVSMVAFFAASRWSRLLSGCVFLLTASFMVYTGLTRGWNVSRILGPVCCVLAAAGYLRKGESTEDDNDEDRGMISIVGLVSELPFLDESVLSRHIENAWDVSLDPTSDDPQDFVVGEAPLFVVRARDCMFMVHYFDRPYFDDPQEVSASMRDLRVGHVVEQHTGWFSVDLMSAEDDADATDPANYAMIGKLFAEIVDDHCLALLFPAFQSCIPWEAGFEQSLRTDNPLSALNVDYLPVVRVDASDPRMLAAVEEARSRFDEFVSAFESRTSDEESYAVKAPIEAGDNTEVIWITVQGIENGVIYGELANDPVDLGRLKLGDRVKSRVDDLNDWMYTRGDEEPVGGFTVKVLSEIYAEPVPEADEENAEGGPSDHDTRNRDPDDSPDGDR
ncbi:MAG: DUF2314 domain-containing protein [Planctomycetaceae bacterium]|nr:DUF2314 domain-containing protein [Planctomycetaceae bacterium]